MRRSEQPARRTKGLRSPKFILCHTCTVKRDPHKLISPGTTRPFLLNDFRAKSCSPGSLQRTLLKNYKTHHPLYLNLELRCPAVNTHPYHTYLLTYQTLLISKVELFGAILPSAVSHSL